MLSMTSRRKSKTSPNEHIKIIDFLRELLKTLTSITKSINVKKLNPKQIEDYSNNNPLKSMVFSMKAANVSTSFNGKQLNIIDSHEKSINTVGFLAQSVKHNVK